jgi:hypothetical protein
MYLQEITAKLKVKHFADVIGILRYGTNGKFYITSYPAEQSIEKDESFQIFYGSYERCLSYIQGLHTPSQPNFFKLNFTDPEIK